MSGVDFIRPGAEIVVLLDGREASSVVTPLTITRSFGGGDGDRCVCRANRDSRYLQDATLAPPLGRLEVFQKSQEDKEQRLFVGWGAGAIHDLDQEQVLWEFRIGRMHFGDALDGMPEYDPRAEEVRTLARDWVFNPIIDGAVRGNRRPERSAASGSEAEDEEEPEPNSVGPGKSYVTVDWESLRTKQARKAQGIPFYGDGTWERSQTKMLWTLPSAVHALCWTLNPKEEYLRNPTWEQLVEVLDGSRSLMRNVVAPLGRRLNEALDLVLGSVGYGWFVDPADEPEGEKGDDGRGKPSIRIVRRGSGPEKALYLQKPTDSAEAARNNLVRSTIASGSQTTFNRVRVFGGFEQREVTIPLVPAWAQEDDGLLDDDTAKDSEGYAVSPRKQRVHREFVANEAGDYVGSRPAIKKPLDLSEYLGQDVLPRRRRAYPCLTKGADGGPIGDDGTVIEYRLKGEDGAFGGDWLPLEELYNHGGVKLLEQEIGIRFDGVLVPVDVQDAFVGGTEGIEFQLTCTLQSDVRLEAESDPSPQSPQPEIVTEVIDAADRFQLRKVDKSSRHYRGNYQFDEVDDTRAAKEYANRLIEAWDMLDLGGSATVAGLDGPWYELGDVITSVSGRNLKYQAVPDGDKTRYPQVTSLLIDLVSHGRTLVLATLRDEVRR